MMDTGHHTAGCTGALRHRDVLLPLIKGVIFDLDGTLIDSEPVYWENDQVFLARYGIDFTEELNEAMFGWGAVDFFTKLQQLFPSSPLNEMPLSERLRLKDEAYLELARNRTRVFPGVAVFARNLVAHGVPVAIASGSSPLAIDRTLGYAGLGELFPVRVSAIDVPRGKPSPDIFLEAARRIGVDPALCLVLEDSMPGVQAAKAAGMACIALPAPVLPVHTTDKPRAVNNDSDRVEGDKGVACGFAIADMLIPGGAAFFDPAKPERVWRFA